MRGGGEVRRGGGGSSHDPAPLQRGVLDWPVALEITHMQDPRSGHSASATRRLRKRRVSIQVCRLCQMCRFWHALRPIVTSFPQYREDLW